MLLEKIIEYAKTLNDCRGIILETQTCNYHAIQLYKILVLFFNKIVHHMIRHLSKTML